MVRVARRLREAGHAVAVLDLTAVGQNLTADQWYDGLLMSLGQQLGVEDELEDFYLDSDRLGPMQRFFEALRSIVLPSLSGRRLIIFVDEIDAVRSLPFPADEFFLGIREAYNRRADAPEYNRLTFCLFGTATPADLIQHSRLSPFNIGRRVLVTDFTPEEASPLAHGLGPNGPAVLARVLHWTDGHPNLTQRLCQSVAQNPTPNTQHPTPALVDRVCEMIFLTRVARDADDNLSFVRNYLLEQKEYKQADILDLYAQIFVGKRVPNDETNPLCSILKLSGVAKQDARGNLIVRNRIYRHAFDRAWITENMPGAELTRIRAATRLARLQTAVFIGGFILPMFFIALGLWLSKSDVRPNYKISDDLRLLKSDLLDVEASMQQYYRTGKDIFRANANKHAESINKYLFDDFTYSNGYRWVHVFRNKDEGELGSSIRIWFNRHAVSSEGGGLTLKVMGKNAPNFGNRFFTGSQHDLDKALLELNHELSRTEQLEKRKSEQLKQIGLEDVLEFYVRRSLLFALLSFIASPILYVVFGEIIKRRYRIDSA